MLNELEHLQQLVRFASFELDPVSGELRRGEITVHLQPQPLKLLLTLLRRPHELVTREELKQELMPDAAYGDFDHAINLAVSKLRAALNDSSEAPQLIETLPRRGYRFVGKIEPQDGESGPTVLAESRQRTWVGRRTTWVAFALVGVVGVLALIVYLRTRGPQKLTEKDTIVLADFDNKTGESIFDETLKTSLAIALNQSPFLNVLSDKKVADTLTLMKLPVTTKLTTARTQELCRRAGSRVYIAGSIAGLGSEYLLTLQAFDCATGDTVFQEQAEVQHKEVLKTLGKEATVLRLALGESLKSIRQFDVPLEGATTPSLEALQAYSLGLKQALALDFSGARDLYQRAVDLDPNFAMAYSGLGYMLRMAGDDARAEECAAKAFALRERVTERERLSIEATHYRRIGDLENARRVAELWKSLYPRDGGPYSFISAIYDYLGQYEESYFAARESLMRDPNPAIRRTLAYEAIQSNHFYEAEKAVADAEAAQRAGKGSWDPMMSAYYRYKIAFLRHDALAMQQLVESAPTDSKFQHWLLFDRSQTEAYFGRVRQARELNSRAIRWASDLHRVSDAGLYGMAPQAMWEANFGNFAEARHLAAEALAIDSEKDVRAAAGLAFARSGDFTQAGKLADDLATKNPSDTLLKRRTVPMIRAAIAIGRNHPSQAVELLQDAVPIELGDPQVIYTRGQAFLAMHAGKEAAAEFQKLIDHPYVLIEDPLGALAHLGIARAHALTGDTQKARAEYQTLLTLWKDADPDIPVLIQAKAEYAKLH